MKNLLILFCFTCIIGPNYSISAQNSTDVLENNSEKYLERSPVYDYQELQLNNTDTIPGFESKMNKLKISGTIYESDGVTPAKDVILFIQQADERGDFNVQEYNDKQYLYHRGWIKTDADGRYTFYTFVPGNDRHNNQLQQLIPVIKEPSKSEYEIGSFLFDEDPLLSKHCRKRIAKKSDPSRILKLKKIDKLLVARKNIVLASN